LNVRPRRVIQRWRVVEAVWHIHPMSEADEPKRARLAQASPELMAVDTMGGRVHVRWDDTAQATPQGQIVFFAKIPAAAGVFDRWVQGCPMRAC
jgi:hypothetical protein